MATDQVKRLFKAALQRGTEERAGFLDGLGATRATMFASLESL